MCGVIISDIRNAIFVNKATELPLESEQNLLLWLVDFIEGVKVVKFRKGEDISRLFLACQDLLVSKR